MLKDTHKHTQKKKISNKQTKNIKRDEETYLNERKMRLEREVLSFLRMMAEKWAMPIYYLLIRIYKNQNILQDPHNF